MRISLNGQCSLYAYLLGLVRQSFVKWMPGVWKQPSYWRLFRLYIIWEVPKPLTQRYFSIKCHALCLNSHYLASVLQSALGQMQNKFDLGELNSAMGDLWIEWWKWVYRGSLKSWKGVTEGTRAGVKERKLTESPEAERCAWSKGSWEGNGPDADWCSLPPEKQTDALQQEGQCRAEDQAAGLGLLLNPGFIPVWIS